MEIHLPNSAHLQNLEGFLRRCSFEPHGELNIAMHPRWVSVHPAVISLVACAGVAVRASGGSVTLRAPNKKMASLRYLQRMKLFEHIEVDPAVHVVEHEAAGRFIPVTQIRTPQDLSAFMIDMIPLLHLSPDEAMPVRYVVSELVRNVLEHSESEHGAFVCAQYYKESRKMALGVADAGVGIQKALAYSYPTRSALDAILLALRPGVTGTTKRLGGNEYNAGAGLFFTKSIACISNTHMVVYSDDGFFKLRRTPSAQPGIIIRPDPRNDYRTTLSDLPRWGGTVIGIDVGLDSGRSFSKLLDAIKSAYNIDIRTRKQQKYRKPRFS